MIRKVVTIILILSIMVSAMVPVSAETDEKIVGDLRWDFFEDAEGFTVEKRAIINGVVDGALSVTSQRDDPIIRARNIEIDPNVHKYLRFSIKNNTPSDYVEFTFIDAENLVWYIPFTVESNSDSFIEYEIDIANSVHADSDFDNYTDSEKYTKLRFDPMNNVTVNTVEIDYIILSSLSKEEEAPSLVREISIAGKKVYNFDSGAPIDEICNANVYSETYESLSAEDIEVVFGSTFSDGKAEISIKEIENRKIVDIKAVSGDVHRSYRLMLKPIDRIIYVMIDNCELSNKKLKYSGYVIDGDGMVVVCPVTVIAHVKGYDIHENIKYINVMMTNEDGEFSGEVALYDEETEPLMYEMEIAFDVMSGEETVFEYSLYINNTKINTSLDELKNSDLDVIEFMADGENKRLYEKAGIWFGLYGEQDAEKKAEINSMLESKRNMMTAENMTGVVNGSILASLLGNLKGKEIRERIIEIDKEMNAIEVDGKSFSELNESEQNWIAENLIQNNKSGAESHENLYAEVRKSMLLSRVNNAKYMEIKELLLTNTDILENEMTELKNEKSEKIVDKAMKAVVLKADEMPFEDIDKVIEAVNEALSEAGESSTTNGGGNSGGGGGAGSSSGGKVGNTVTVANPEINEKPAKEKEQVIHPIFADMNGFEWAENAVTALYNKGVVKGTGNERFEPGRTVTREEFVKMIVEAFGLGPFGNVTSFEDVENGDWFAPYVAVALEKGIVNGVSENQFGAGMTITREDMSTILYRTIRMINKTLKYSEKGYEFDDWAEVSEYAKEAVGMLYGNGIVNGTGNGNFAPRANATRAEATVIIFRCMEEL